MITLLAIVTGLASFFILIDCGQIVTSQILYN